VIGFTIACIISFLAPLTMAGLNPARDLGPRLVLLLSGWKQYALPEEGFLASK
jgi:glycerol uptake facilitator protein